MEKLPMPPDESNTNETEYVLGSDGLRRARRPVRTPGILGLDLSNTFQLLSPEAAARLRDDLSNPVARRGAPDDIIVT